MQRYFWYTYYKSIGHRQMFLLPADSADSADRAVVVYTETRSHVRKRSVENTQRRTTAPFCVAVVSSQSLCRCTLVNCRYLLPTSWVW